MHKRVLTLVLSPFVTSGLASPVAAQSRYVLDNVRPFVIPSGKQAPSKELPHVVVRFVSFRDTYQEADPSVVIRLRSDGTVTYDGTILGEAALRSIFNRKKKEPQSFVVDLVKEDKMSLAELLRAIDNMRGLVLPGYSVTLIIRCEGLKTAVRSY